MRVPKWLRRVTRYLWREWIKPIGLVAIIVFPLKSAVADWNWVPSGSMKPTILEGDLVLVNKLAYDLKVPFTLQRLAEWDNPARGDIVVFFSPHDGMRLVKRVVAVPGDTIELRNNVLLLNGKAMTYESMNAQAYAKEIYEDTRAVLAIEQGAGRSHLVMELPSRRAPRTFDSITVPPGKYFMMGDSRDNSFDSRFWGFAERKQIVGKANRVLLSFDKNHHYVPRLGRTFSPLD
jgi:signal peptidase I